MDDLVPRLLEAIAETEREARERRGVWPHPSVNNDGAVWLHIKRGGQAVVVHYRHPVEGYGDMADLKAWAESTHGQDRDAILRRCAADRVIVQQHQPAPVVEEGDQPNCGVCIEPGYIGLEFCCDWPRVPWPCPTFRATMSAYGLSDHQEGGTDG